MGSAVRHNGTKTPLYTLLWERRIPIAGQNRKFIWPYELLKTLMTPDLVYKVLISSSINERDATKYRDLILGVYGNRFTASSKTYRRILAIFVLQDRVSDVGKFLREKLHDGLFPLDRTEGREIAQKCFELLEWEEEDMEYFNGSELRVSVE
jgi:hypothetical protein